MKNDLKKIIFEEYSKIINENNVFDGSETIAYHCGRDIGSGLFSLSFIGSGEGYHSPPLGPGIYFATNENIARMYCKYVKNPVFYEVSIPTSGLYNSSWGTPKNLRDNVYELFNRESEARKWRDRKTNPILQLVDMMGADHAIKSLINAGINGAWEDLPAGGKEIAVFNPSIIKIIRKEGEVKKLDSLKDKFSDFIFDSISDSYYLIDEFIEKGGLEKDIKKKYVKDLESDEKLVLDIFIKSYSTIISIDAKNISGPKTIKKGFNFDVSSTMPMFMGDDILDWLDSV